ncbi:LOW QUALITY PROTEIN: hypothetical protein U9M48_007924, partial [Paspalum notatum var. saurae]
MESCFFASTEREEIVFFDVETSMPPERQLLEFGAIVLCPRTLVELFPPYLTLVRPADLDVVPATTARRNGITRDVVADAPPFRDVADYVYHVLHGRVWAGHNIVNFDSKIIFEAFAEIGRLPPQPKGMIDTLDLLTQRFRRRTGDMKLESLANYFGLGRQRHRSLDDVRMNIDVLKCCATVLFLEESPRGVLIGAPLEGTRRQTDPRPSGHSEFLEPGDVSTECITISAPLLLHQFGPRAIIQHKSAPLQLSCAGLKVCSVVQAKFRNKAGRQKLNLLVDIPENLREVLQFCDGLAQSHSQAAGSNSEWIPLVWNYGNANFPTTVRLNIQTVVYGDTAFYSTHIYQKDCNGVNIIPELVSREVDVEELNSLLRGNKVDAFFSLELFDCHQKAGIRLVAKRLDVHFKWDRQGIGNLCLQSINGSYIILIPKVHTATKVSDYRPISLLNYSIKLITKLLANRLHKVIQTLIHKNQYGFIQSRTIQDCLAWAFEYLHICHHSKKEIVILKLDFEKTFDKVKHQATLEIMKVRSFGLKWLHWMQLIMNSGTSSVLLNGIPGKTFHCRRRVRQGDPLSPLLFVLVADLLQTVLNRAKDLGLLTLPIPLNHTLDFPILQYADDTLIVMEGDARQLFILKALLNTFADSVQVALELKTQNEALQLKFLHNFFNKNDIPWVHLIWEKYYNTGSLPKLKSKGSFWWRDVLKLLDKFKGMVRPIIGNGTSCYLWNDLWSNNIISATFPELMTVTLGLTFGYLHISQPRRYMIISLAIDQYILHLSGCGSHLAKTNARLITREILRRKSMYLPSYECALCQSGSEETLEHLFLHCAFASDCWALLGLTVEPHLTIFQ